MNRPVVFTHDGPETIGSYYSSATRGRPSQHAANGSYFPQYLMKSLGSFATITKKLPPHLHPAPQRTWGTHRMPSWENQINVAEKAPGRLVIKLFQKINATSRQPRDRISH